jgi:hypothetical protein
MALTFHQVPDWISWENQGGNIAVFDLDKDGLSELIVLRIDHHTPGPNAGFYRVGKKLADDGTVGTWGPWIQIPDWNSNENEGGGIAVADFGAGGLALVVFQVQHLVPGPNAGLFRVGRKLDTQGNVTGGWTHWFTVPNWISWRDQGAAITIADLDGSGTPALIVFHIDDFHTGNPTRPNKGFYRVGKGLTPNGQIASWGDWISVDWFSWFNQGAGIGVADLNGDGKSELVVFQIDDPPGQNAGWYKIGWNLDADAIPREGWGSWQQFAGWGSFEDEGGGLALALFGAERPKAIVFHIDNPPQLNAGLYAVSDLELDIDQAADIGVWRRLPYFSQVLPIHAALLRTGKVMFFAGSGNNVFRHLSPDFGNEADQIFTSVVWDFATNSFDHPPTFRRPDNSVVDFFCGGHSALPDGRIVVAGGSDKYDKIVVNGQMQNAPGHGFTGTRDTIVFDPVAEQWIAGRPMQRGRWYPTLVTLSDGRVIAASGLDDQAVEPSVFNGTLEINADPQNANWAKIRDFNLPLYPHLFLLRDGRIFYTGGKMDTDGFLDPFIFDPLNPTNAIGVGGLVDADRCNQCASVLLPPAQSQKVMILGGGPDDETETTDRVQIVDLSAANPQYGPRKRLNFDRMHVNAVLLPDRTVLATGGGGTREASAIKGQIDPQPVRERLVAEIFNPDTEAWRSVASATVARLYHSVALLLPDGRVVAAGGNPDKGSQVNWLPPDPLEEMRLELYSPPYMFKGARPAITDIPAEIVYGQQIVIKTTQASNIKWVSLIRPGLTTHSFNCEQRLIDVPFDLPAQPSQLNATIPSAADRSVATRGWYMLFLTNNNNVPSVARWVHLS